MFAVAAAGAAAVTALLALAPNWQAGRALFLTPGPDGVALLLVLFALTCAAELVAVPLRREDALEELTLLDAVVVLNVLLLSVPEALLASLGGLLLAYVLRRRQPIKVVFNLGTYGCAGSATIGAVHLSHVTPGQFDLHLALAMVAAAACFVMVNTVTMALLLATMGSGSVAELIREELPLTALTIAGTVGLAGTVLAMAVRTPVLLPCAILPAAALWYAYGASADKHEERRRSARVLAFSQVLATSPDRQTAVHGFLHLAREEFTSDGVLALTQGDTIDQLVAGQQAPLNVAFSSQHQIMADAVGQADVVCDDLPQGWAVAMVVPLVADGRRLGCVLVGSKRRHGIRARDLTAVIPLAGALAVALRNAEQAEALKSEATKLRAVVEQSGDGIVVLDGEGVVHLWSPAMAALTGVEASTAVGSAVSALLRLNDMSGHEIDAFGSALSSVSPEAPHVTLELQLDRRDGERKAVRFSHAFVFEDRVLARVIVNVSDRTAQWRAERMKTDFVATVSHELRTPLTPIKGYAELLRRRGDDVPAAKRDRALDLIIDRANHLGRLVDDLLLASSITSGAEPHRPLDCTSQDLAELAARALEDFPDAAKVSLVQAPLPVLVAGDATRILQIVTNLVSNAMKYSPDDTPITVAVAADGLGGLVRVTDGGSGIPQDQLTKIFEKFHRVEDPFVMSTSGTGLGLFISRHLAQAMRGELTVESTLGVGSEFTLWLPADQAVEEPYVTS